MYLFIQCQSHRIKEMGYFICIFFIKRYKITKLIPYLNFLKTNVLILQNHTGIGAWGRIHKRFTGNSDLRWTFKARILLNSKNFGWVTYSNNFIKCLYNRVRCILVYNFSKLGELWALKIHRKIRCSVNRFRIPA